MPFSRIPASALVLVAAVALGACHYSGGALVARDSLEESRALEPDGRFELENVNGRITLATWSKDEVLIEAERAAVSEEALERIQIDIDGEGDEVRVKTRYPRSKPWFMAGNPGKVDYHVTLPAGARARLKTVNGPVDVEGLHGDLRVESVNGGLELDDVGGEVRAHTVNGGIHAVFDVLPADGHHEFRTVNGGIEVTLPEGTTGRLEARTVNGSIDCDLPLDVERKSKRRLVGRLGPGGGSFDVDTVNGSVDVRRSLGRLPAEAEES
ncbi:MAG: DUF4097 family beta strand repeat-containing protein [Acidobacteriota bacterium]